MSNQKVSVIIPVYNTAESLLDRSIKSVITQNIPSIEIILIDDGSDTPTAKHCDHLATKYPNITTIHQKNHGVSHARNQGLEISRGEWVAFLDPDDAFLPNFLPHAIHLAQKFDLDIVYGKIFDEWGENLSLPNITNPLHDFRVYTKQNDLSALRSYFVNRLSPPHPAPNFNVRFNTHAKLYKKAILENVRFQEGLPISEDSVFNADASYVAKRVGVSNQFWHVYYHHAGSVSKALILDKSPDFGSLLHEAYAIRGYSTSEYNVALIQNIISNLRSVSRIQKISRRKFQEIVSDPSFSEALSVFTPTDFAYVSRGSALRFRLLKGLPATLYWLLFVALYGRLSRS